MILTTLEGYAIKALMYIAIKEDKKATVSEIARSNNVSFPYILRICALLRAYGILESEKGRGGGYILVRDARSITLLEIIKAVGREGLEVKCEFGRKTEKCKPSDCISLHSLEFLRIELDKFLSKITLQDLIERRKTYANLTNTGR